MNRRIEQILDSHLEDLEKINNRRRSWLYASSIVVIGIIFIIFSWDWLDHFHQSSVWWVIVSLMLVISINWWYWTMRVVRLLLDHQHAQHMLLRCIIEDVVQSREDIKHLVTNNVDSDN
jgi:hypothetical protein